MASRRTMLKALSRRGQLIYGRVRTSKKGLKSSERWEPFVSKSSARQIVTRSNKRFRKQGVKSKIIKFRKSSPYRRR